MDEYDVTDVVSGGMYVDGRYVRWYYEPSRIVPRDAEERTILEWLAERGMAQRAGAE